MNALWVDSHIRAVWWDVYFIVHSFLFSVNVRYVHRLSVWAQCIFTAWPALPPLPQRSPLKVRPVFPAWRQWMLQGVSLSASLLWASVAFRVAEAHSRSCQVQCPLTALLPFRCPVCCRGRWAVSSLGCSAAVNILERVFQGTPVCSSVGYTSSITHTHVRIWYNPLSHTCVRVEYTSTFFSELGC